ncbi:hypothetical protein BH20ACI1_BH20ACI1_24660 [soil metagenome]
MKDFVWVKNKIDDVFYPSNETVLKDETDAYRQTFKYLLESLELFLMTDAHLNIDANIGVFYNKTKLSEFVYFDIVAINNPRQEKRSSYCIWKDEFKPTVAFEILKGTSSSEIVNQLEVLKTLGVKEQYIFDPEYDYLREGLVAYHLKDGEFEEVKIKEGRIFSPALGLEIVNTGETLRLFNPETKDFLPMMKKTESKIEKAKLKRQN